MNTKLDFDTKVLIGLGSLFIFSFLVYIVLSVVQQEAQKRDFIEREIGGRLVDIHSIGKGRYDITIRQHKTRQELTYSLSSSPFISENNIQVNDSITKEANGHTINFFKKKNKTYEKCCELYYY